MELGYAVNYIFEDKDWVKKLIPLAGLGLLSAVLLIFFGVGLLAAAPALGFLLQLAQNVRQGLPRPLPTWKDWSKKFEIGGQLLLAIIAYHLPIVFLSLCSSLLINGVGGGFMGSTVFVFVLCCTVPMLIIYIAVVYPMLAIAAAEYIETNEWQRFFRPLHLFDVFRNNTSLCLRWLMFSFLVNLVLGLLLLIPCIGWTIILVFGYPVHGHLLGQFAHRISLSNKPQSTPKKHPA